MSFKLLPFIFMCEGTIEGANRSLKFHMILNWHGCFNDSLDPTKHFPRDSIDFNKHLLKAFVSKYLSVLCDKRELPGENKSGLPCVTQIKFCFRSQFLCRSGNVLHRCNPFMRDPLPPHSEIK